MKCEPLFFSLNQHNLCFAPLLFRIQCLGVKCRHEKKCFKNEVLIMSYGPDRKLREEPLCYFSSRGWERECVKMLFIFQQATWAWHHVNPQCSERFLGDKGKLICIDQMCVSRSSNWSPETDKDVFRQILLRRFLRAFAEVALGILGLGPFHVQSVRWKMRGWDASGSLPFRRSSTPRPRSLPPSIFHVPRVLRKHICCFPAS